MLEVSTTALTLEQEAVVRAVDLEIDKLKPEELRACLKLATRNDLLQTTLIDQLEQQVTSLQSSRYQVVKRVKRKPELPGKLRSR